MNQGADRPKTSVERSTPTVLSEEKPVSTARAATILIIGIAALAMTAPWVKLANFEPATSVILRVAIAIPVLAPFAWRERAKLGGMNRPGVILALVAGFFLGLDFTAWNYSIFFVGSGIASVLLNMQIIILPALAIIFDRYKVPRSYYVLVPIMIFGVILTGGVFDAPPSEGPATVYGVNIAVLGTILGGVSGVCYGSYLYASRKSSMVNVNQGTIAQPILYTCIGQLVAPGIWAFFSGRGLDFTNGVLVDGKLPLNPETTVGDPITLTNWFWIIVLATVGQALAWSFVQYGSIHMDTTIVAGLLLLSPIATVALIAPIMFGEIPSMLQILGVLIVLGAVAYQNKLPQALMRRMRGGKATATIE